MIFEAFRQHRRERAGEPAFLVASGDRALPITWRDFTDDVSAIAWGVAHECPGGKVALLGENSYEWIAAHAAVMFSGAVAVPVDVNLSAGEISARIAEVGAKALVHSALYAEKAAEVARLSPGLTVGGFGSPESDSFIARAKNALAAGEKGIFELPAPDESRTAMIVFTSGTTSEPRGAELTLGGLGAFAGYAAERLRMKSGERSLMLLPLFHVYGIASVYAMLSQAVTLGICPDYRRIYDAAVRFRADFAFLVPALADILISKLERRAGASSGKRAVSLKWICSGGAPLSPRTHGRIKAEGIKVIAAYGLTETTALYSISDVDGETPVGSAGKACTLPGVETKVSQSGELMIRGPNVMKGYYGETARTGEVLDAGGWFATGDFGRIDADGTVWVTGRKSRTIVLSSGKKVAPEELEAKILLYPGIREAVVRGDGGESRGISAEIFADIPQAEVHAAVESMNRTLPIYMRVRKVFVRKKPFPRTASGKIALSGAAPEKRARPSAPVWAMFTVGSVALAVLLVDYLINPWLRGPGSSRFLKSVSCWNELLGEMLLAVFAVVFIVAAWKLKNAFDRRGGGRRRA